jgi:hypothetical protein
VNVGERIRHPAAVKAAVIAAILAGAQASATAKQYGVSKATVSRWLSAASRPEKQPLLDQDRLAESIFRLIEKHIEAIEAQIAAASRPDWVHRQSGQELSALVAVERDGLLRLLAGLRPMQDSAEAKSGDSEEGAVAELDAGELASL